MDGLWKRQMSDSILRFLKASLPHKVVIIFGLMTTYNVWSGKESPFSFFKSSLPFFKQKLKVVQA
jgi:hypothetical protein